MANATDGGGVPPAGANDSGDGNVSGMIGWGPGGEAGDGAPPCPDCRGGGRVALLTSSVPCGKCGGTGRVAYAGGVGPAAGTTRCEYDENGELIAVYCTFDAGAD